MPEGICAVCKRPLTEHRRLQTDLAEGTESRVCEDGGIAADPAERLDDAEPMDER